MKFTEYSSPMEKQSYQISKKTGEYKKAFEELGMTVEKSGTYFFDTFPPLSIIIATKR